MLFLQDIVMVCSVPALKYALQIKVAIRTASIHAALPFVRAANIPSAERIGRRTALNVR